MCMRVQHHGMRMSTAEKSCAGRREADLVHAFSVGTRTRGHAPEDFRVSQAWVYLREVLHNRKVLSALACTR